MSDARWADVADDWRQAARHFRNAVALFDAGGFDEPGLGGYRAGMALMHALQSGHTSAEVGMERILTILDEDRPAGADWHRRIIDRLSREGPSGFERPALLSPEIARDLQETRRFRNLAMHSYGDFEPARAGPTIEAARRLAGGLAMDLLRFRSLVDPAHDASTAL